MTWFSRFRFSFAKSSPSQYHVKEEYIGIHRIVDEQNCFQWYYREFEKFKSGKYPGKYLKVSIIRRERYTSENYEDTEEGAFFCRIVDCILPTLDFKLQLYNKKLKSFHFAPGQVKLELPDGTVIPLLSDAVRIVEPDDYGAHYHISQSLSREFLDTCKRHLYPGRRTELSDIRTYLCIEDGIAVAYKLYEEDKLTSLAEDLIFVKNKRETATIKERSGASACVPEIRWTSSKIEKLWKESNVSTPI